MLQRTRLCPIVHVMSLVFRYKQDVYINPDFHIWFEYRQYNLHFDWPVPIKICLGKKWILATPPESWPVNHRWNAMHIQPCMWCSLFPPLLFSSLKPLLRAVNLYHQLHHCPYPFSFAVKHTLCKCTLNQEYIYTYIFKTSLHSFWKDKYNFKLWYKIFFKMSHTMLPLSLALDLSSQSFFGSSSSPCLSISNWCLVFCALPQFRSLAFSTIPLQQWLLGCSLARDLSLHS